MLKFTLRRLLQMVVVLVVLSVLLFGWLHSLPGGPAGALLGVRGDAESLAALEEALGLDQPVWVQYGRFVVRALSGDFGTSNGVLRGADAMDVFLTRLPATIELSMLALIIAVSLAIPVGYTAARRSGGLLDTGSIIGSLVGVAIPIFFLAFVLKYIFAIRLGILPPSGRQSTGLNATEVTGFFLLDSVMTREWDATWDTLKHLILPAFALATFPFAVLFRITRASVLEVLEEDYVRTANAKGLTTRVIRGRHVLRNALIPVVTTIGLLVGGLLSGAVLTESVFNYQGVGQALALGFSTRDYPVLQVLIMMAALIYIVVNLVVDIAYAFIDPRIRVSSR